jgi:hypothetical protein
MDSSISPTSTTHEPNLDPVHVILGDYQYRASSLSPQQIVDILFGLLEKMRPHLMHMPGFESISALRRSEGYLTQRVAVHGLTHVFKGGDLSEQTKVLWLYNLSFKSSTDSGLAQRMDLMLAESGAVLINEYSYTSQVGEGCTIWTIRDSTFSRVDKSCLVNLAPTTVNWADALRSSITALWEQSSVSIKRRERYLTNAKQMHAVIERANRWLKF